MALRIVCCRAGRVLAPPVKSGNRCSRRLSNAWGGKHLDERRGQFNRQRETIQPRADFGDGRGVVVRDREVRFDGLRPLR